MRRSAHLSARALLVLLLLAAVVDLPLPASSRPRRRLHLIDRSASVSLGPGSALKLKDAEAMVAFDRGLGGEVLSASFAGGVSFESAVVDDPSRSRLRGALEAVLGRDPTEIVLHSDGRADPGPALLLCKARGVPVHVFPLGPVEIRDIRFTRVRAPSDAAPGERFAVEATLEATWSVKAGVRLGDEVREVELAAGAPATVVFSDRTAGEHPLSITTADAVAENNAVSVRVLTRTSRRRVVAIPGTGLPEPGDVDFLRAAAPGDLTGVHAVVVNGRAPAGDVIARYVREGGGVLFVGGPASFASGGWAGTALEEISPLRANPAHPVAVVFAVDTSGSMQKDDRIGRIVRAAVDTSAAFDPGDRVLFMAFSDKAEFMSAERLAGEKALGETHIVRALQKAKQQLDEEPAGRKHILLFTDGVTAREEQPVERENAWKALGAVGLTVITIDKELDIARPNVPLKDVDQLAAELQRLFAGIRETLRERPGTIDLLPHPVTNGLGAIAPAALNLTTEKPGVQLAASWGRAPAVYPAIAFSQAGHGKSGAIAFVPDATLLSRAIAHVARPASGAYRLTVEPPLVRARGPGTSSRLLARAGGLEFYLHQVRSDVWEGVLPETKAGTILVELAEGGQASAVLPCLPEFERVGVDGAALERIAAETGGRRLSGSAELAGLPPPPSGGSRSGRPIFLLAALAAIFLELAISTFWKPR